MTRKEGVLRRRLSRRIQIMIRISRQSRRREAGAKNRFKMTWKCRPESAPLRWKIGRIRIIYSLIPSLIIMMLDLIIRRIRQGRIFRSQRSIWRICRRIRRILTSWRGTNRRKIAYKRSIKVPGTAATIKHTVWLTVLKSIRKYLRRKTMWEGRQMLGVWAYRLLIGTNRNSSRAILIKAIEHRKSDRWASLICRWYNKRKRNHITIRPTTSKINLQLQI